MFLFFILFFLQRVFNNLLYIYIYVYIYLHFYILLLFKYYLCYYKAGNNFYTQSTQITSKCGYYPFDPGKVGYIIKL